MTAGSSAIEIVADRRVAMENAPRRKACMVGRLADERSFVTAADGRTIFLSNRHARYLR
jgi:hypothetical protein